MSPKRGRQLHLVMIGFWVINLILANYFMDMTIPVRYLVNISIYANIVGHWSGWSAERPVEIHEGD